MISFEKSFTRFWYELWLSWNFTNSIRFKGHLSLYSSSRNFEFAALLTRKIFIMEYSIKCLCLSIIMSCYTIQIHLRVENVIREGSGWRTKVFDNNGSHANNQSFWWGEKSMWGPFLRIFVFIYLIKNFILIFHRKKSTFFIRF